MSCSVELTQVLIAKFCHDLAGTMGAVGNAIEFLSMDNEQMRKKAVDLVSVSAQHAIANLRFFREAYGISKNRGEANLDDIRELCTVFLECSSKITLDFQRKYCHQPEVFISLGIGKLVLCVVSVAATTLLHGGVIKVEVDKTSAGAKVIISGIGSGLKINEVHHNILRGKTKDTTLSTLNVHYYYTRMLLEELGAKLVINSHSDKIEYIVEQRPFARTKS